MILWLPPGLADLIRVLSDRETADVVALYFKVEGSDINCWPDGLLVRTAVEFVIISLLPTGMSPRCDMNYYYLAIVVGELQSNYFWFLFPELISYGRIVALTRIE